MDNTLLQDIINNLSDILGDLVEIFEDMRTNNIDIDDYVLENIQFNYPQPDEYGIVYIIDSLSDISNLGEKKNISEIADSIVSLYKEIINQDQFLNMFKPKN